MNNDIKELTFRDIIKDFYGGNSFTVKDYKKNGIPVLTKGDIKPFGRIEFNGIRFIDPKDQITKGYRLTKKDDFILTTRDLTQAADFLGLLSPIPEPYYFLVNQGANIVRFRDNVDPSFVIYWTHSRKYRLHIKNHAVGSTQIHLRKEDFLSAPISLPRIESQKKVSEILYKFDARIELNKEKSKTLEEIAKALFKSWFIDFDPVKAKAEGRSTGLPDEISDLFPDSLEDSELGKIPTGWNISNLGEISEVIDCLHSKKPAREDHGHLLLQLNNITENGILDISDKYLITNNDYEKWTSRMETRQGDCVITNVGRVGAVSQIPPKVKAALGRNMTAVRAKEAFPFPTFILEYLLSTLGRNEIRMNIDLGTILNALNVKSIPKLRFTSPGVDLCRHYEYLARPFRENMEKIHIENQSIALVRNALLPKLITGEIKIPDAEKIIEEAGI